MTRSLFKTASAGRGGDYGTAGRVYSSGSTTHKIRERKMGKRSRGISKKKVLGNTRLNLPSAEKRGCCNRMESRKNGTGRGKRGIARCIHSRMKL